MKSLAVVTGAVMVTAAVGAWAVLPGLLGGQPAPPPVPRTVNVRVQVIIPTEVADSVRLPAVLAPGSTVTVSAEVSGRVEKIACAEGGACRAGDVLVELRSDLLKAEADAAAAALHAAELGLTRARQLLEKDVGTQVLAAEVERQRARAELARADHARTEQLHRGGNASREALDAAVAARDQSRAELQAAELQLEQARIRRREELEGAEAVRDQARAALDAARARLERAAVTAPAAGTVDELLVEAGEFVGPGTPVARIIDTSRVMAICAAPERDVQYLAVGRPAEVQVAVRGEPRALAGTVSFVSGLADPRTHSSRVEVTLDNPGGLLRAGQVAVVRLPRRELAAAVMVPLAAVIPQEQGHAVYVVAEGAVEEALTPEEIAALPREARSDPQRLRRSRPGPVALFREVQLDTSVLRNAGGVQQVRVAEGLASGDRLIVEGQRLVGPNQPVAIVGGRKAAVPGTRAAPSGAGGR